MATEVAILRRCQCCDELRSIDQFDGLKGVCERCIASALSARAGHRRPLHMVLTDKGRAAIREAAA